MKDILNYDTFKKVKFINKGWSKDRKYYVETEDGRKLLLRVSDICEYDIKKLEFEIMQQIIALGIPMSKPLDFGICSHGEEVYSLLTWCEGEAADVVLPSLTETEQYSLGVKAGEILKEIHSIKAPEEQEEWSSHFNRKAIIKIEKYRSCGIRFNGDDNIINYIENNRSLLFERPQCFHHGDYHVGNMIISPENNLSIIDFNRHDYGDPWEEFNRIVWSAASSPHFAIGQINDYFNNKPPMEFFKLLAFYIASNTLSSIYWSIPFGEKEIEIMKKQAKDVLLWFDNMNNPVPCWYLEV